MGRATSSRGEPEQTPPPRVLIDVLGPLRVTVDDVERPVTASRQRAVLVCLARRVGEAVSADRLLEDVWSPHVPETGSRAVAYQVSKLSAIIIRLIGMRTRYYTMPNVMADELLVPEFIQEDMTSNALSDAVLGLLKDPARREAISRRFAKLRSELALGADECAADAVIKLAQ